MGGPQSPSGRGGEEKNFQLLPGLEPLIMQPIFQCCTTELSRLNGRGGEEKVVPAPAQESSLSHPARSLVTILTELPRLQIRGRDDAF
jgi:hypothetical protein